ncbi:MAG: hypothetical protein CMD18_01460 [Flavobacteriales bacterium]|nr:hypothetical protein [Flavobacteriales bacterium]
MKKITIAILASLFILSVKSQNEKFQINGSARSYLFSNELQIEKSLDSITPRKSNYGHNLLDLGITVYPNAETEVIGIFRMRNELGGFWGGGVTFNVRQLTLKGVANKVVRYEIGDIDLKMTPYTLFNTTEEGVINESDIFKVRRQVFHYDLFYQKNQWRMQGAKIDFNVLTNSVIKKTNVKGYLTRQRATDGLNQPERLYGGGSLNLICNSRFNFKINSSNLFDLTKTLGNDSTKFTNSVLTSVLTYKLMNKKSIALEILGEGGFSNSNYIYYSNFNAPESLSDWFYDIASSTHFKEKKIIFKLGVKDIGKDFRSPGAQTKRVNYSQSPGLYQQFTNDFIGREVNFSDIINGNADATFKISETLMAYKAAYSNTNPYGDATPNRRGLYINIESLDSLKTKNNYLKCIFLQESVGSGTLKRKSFILTQIGSNIMLNNLLKFKKPLKINLGLRNEITLRGGEEYEKISLSSNFLDAGLSYEFIPKLNLLFGVKVWQAKGNENLIIRDEFNTVIDFDAIDINFRESIVAGGFKYDFDKKNTLTIQYQNFKLKNSSVNRIDYGISEFIILYSLNF